MPTNEVRKKGQTLKLIVSSFIFIVAGWIFFNRDYVLDEIALYQHQPTSEVMAIAERIKLTDLGRRNFFVSRPEINSAQQFNDNCQAKDEQTIVLGCYTMRRIYLFNVSDERLNGVKEVTAAHEMLHAAYDRLSGREKERIDQLIDKQIAATQDPRITDLIELYNRTEPGQLQNEMHSILPTEVAKLSPELEKYYGQYFKDRQVVVALSSQYEAVFAQNEARRNELQTELESLRVQIESRTASYNGSIARLNNDIETFNRKAQSGSFASQQQFSSERQQLIARQQALQQEKIEIDLQIKLFNQKRQELIALNGEVQSLNKSLDSTPEDVPSF